MISVEEEPDETSHGADAEKDRIGREENRIGGKV